MAAGDRKIVGISDRWFDADNVLVIVVAVATEGVDWAAYQDAVSTERFGIASKVNHKDIQSLLIDRATAYGDKIGEAEARAYFPGVTLPYRR